MKGKILELNHTQSWTFFFQDQASNGLPNPYPKATREYLICQERILF